MKLLLIQGSFSILRYPPEQRIPEWAHSSNTLLSITYTKEELSIVCPSEIIEAGYTKIEEGWACFKVDGPLDFSLTGVISAIASPLSIQEVSIFSLSTYDTDYILVKQENLQKAIKALQSNGFEIQKE